MSMQVYYTMPQVMPYQMTYPVSRFGNTGFSMPPVATYPAPVMAQAPRYAYPPYHHVPSAMPYYPMASLPAQPPPAAMPAPVLSRPEAPPVTASVPSLTEYPEAHSYGPYLKHRHELPYSKVLDAVTQGKVAQARIEWHPDRLTDLPVAKLLTKDNHQLRANLPNNIHPFLSELEKNNVTYEFQEHRATAGERVKNFFGQVMKDSVLPTVILTIGGLMALGLWKYVIKPLQDKAPVENALNKSLKSFEDVNHTVEEELPLYDKHVQQTVKKFLDRNKDFLLFLGPPGTGKTHLLEAIGKAAKDRPDTVVLNANVVDQDTSIRDLLQQIFAGDKQVAERAKAILNKIAKTDVKELVVMVNEIEQFGEVMNDIIVNGMGNPTAPIRLRILSTGNMLPRMSQAANNRIQGGITYVDYTDAEKQSALASKFMAKQFPGFNQETLSPSMERLFNTYPGLSTRTLVEDILKPLADDVRKETTPDVETALKHLETRLSAQSLNDAEIAGLFRSVINTELLDQKTLPQSGVDLLNRKMIQEAQKQSQDLGVELLMSGKQLRPMMQASLRQFMSEHGLSPNNGPEYTRALENMANDLRQGNLMGKKPGELVPKKPVAESKPA